MEKNLNNNAVSHFEELEERLEMAQVAAADTIRCNIGSVSSSLEQATDVDVQP